MVNDIAFNFWLFRLSSKIQSWWFNHGRWSPKIPRFVFTNLSNEILILTNPDFAEQLLFWWKNWNSEFFSKTPKLFCLYLSNQISLRGRFVFKTNGRISSITSYKDHCCSFFTSWVIKQSKSCILTILKKHPTSGVRCAP